MEDDFKEEIIVEDDDMPEEEVLEEENKEVKKEEKQIVITKGSIPFILSIVAICLSFFKTFFTIVLSTSYIALIVLHSIFFAGAVACSVAALVLILLKNKKVAFTPELLLSFVAIVISFI